jgi:RNA polymerase sigma factor (sigma-70 family)
MTHERRSADRPAPRGSTQKRRARRREVPSADLDRLDATSGLWAPEADGGDAPEAPRDDALRDAVRAAIATALSEKQREVVEAHFFEGLSQGDIARRLGITQQVVHKRLYGAPRGGRVIGGALRRLRAELEPLFPARARGQATSP